MAHSHELAMHRERLFVYGEVIQIEHYKSTTDHLVASLWSQLVVSWLLLFAVLAICGAGLAMSWFQLSHSIRRDKPTDSSIQLGSAGLRLDSPIVGLAIFVVSTVFFYLYLTTVYPISILQSKTSTAEIEPPPRAASATRR
jgi:hypothetical protein